MKTLKVRDLIKNIRERVYHFSLSMSSANMLSVELNLSLFSFSLSFFN